MHSFERLIREHDAICLAAAALEKTLTPTRPNVAAALARRERLCTLLNDHLAHEDAEVYPRLIATTHAPTADIAERFSAEYSTFINDWIAYLDRWTPEAIEVEWRPFRRATTAVLDRLRRRIVDENSLLYPSALGASMIALRG